MTTIGAASTATNTSRVSGLASGMDIDTIVSDMMEIAQIPVNKLSQDKQILEWQQEDYRTLNSSLFDFKNDAFDMKLEANFNNKCATSSNATVTDVTAGAAAIEGTYAIKINSLAAGVSKGSTIALADEKDGNGDALSLYNQFTELGLRGLSSTDNIAVTINGTVLEFDLDMDNISTVVSKINDADMGIKASYDTALNRFFLTTTSTGSESEITISADTANFISNGSNDSILNLNIDEGVVHRGQNASIDFGDAAGLESTTNSITVNGLTLNLKDEGDSTLTVTRDINAVVDSIKEFVDSYNETLSRLYSKVQEERDRDYAPLTDAQKEEMSDAEITKWEKQARSGLLRNDTQLQNTISDLRSAMSRVVEGIDGAYESLSQIGINTLSYTDNGKLYIDETALRDALAKDPDGVKELFTNSSSTDDEKGIAYKIYDITSNGIKYISDKAGSASGFSTVDNSYIGKRLTEITQDIEDWEEKLEDIQDRYYSKFTTMETLINQMNTQSSWLSAQFGLSSSSE